ncbi:hypothetical protein GBA52_026115 [Prunus armeniaca]|nr:hypothetical protein GBA52_026115 [Prunus armeniaca]
MVFWEGYVTDEAMGTFAPILVYWLYAGLYQLLPPLDNYRLHTRREEDDKNSVPLPPLLKVFCFNSLSRPPLLRGSSWCCTFPNRQGFDQKL